MIKRKARPSSRKPSGKRKKGVMKTKRPNYAIYVLGAGFSRAGGLPLASELWPEVLRRGLKREGRAVKFRRDLDEYIEYRQGSFGETLTYESINFEQFLGYLDIDFHLGLRGSDTWSRDGNEGQVVVKTLIGQILTEATPPPGRIPQFYVDFARQLEPDDIVLTFNYDILLERALEKAGVKYRLFPERFKTVQDGGMGILDDRHDEVLLFKLHGSVDWFSRRQHNRMELEFVKQGSEKSRARHPIFNPDRYPFTLSRIVDGPRHSDDPFADLYRVQEVERLYVDFPWFQVAPTLTSPSTEKLIYTGVWADFFNGLKNGGAFNFKMAIIGYSLPAHDSYAHQVLYHLVDNYQGIPSSRFGPELPEKKPLVVVDKLAGSDAIAAFQKRYAFVDWGSAILLADGFGPEALKLL